MRLALALAITAALVAGCDEGGPVCDGAELRNRLEGAGPGDTVEVGDCRVQGRFVVPAGATLRGTGPMSEITGDSFGPVVRLAVSGSATTTLSNVTVTSSDHVAVLADGAGAIELRDVVVRVPGPGIGVGLQDLTSAVLATVTVEGPLSASDAARIPNEPTAMEWATHGVVLIGVADAMVSDLVVSGFARFGVLSTDSAVAWSGGRVGDTFGTGVMVSGGTADLSMVAIEGTLRTTGLTPSYGAVWADGATVTTGAVQLRDSEGFGMLQAGATVEHVDLVAENNGDVGVWTQDSAGLTISGTGTLIRGNRVAGIVGLASSGLQIADARIEGTRTGTTAIGTGSVEAGDGIQLVSPRGTTLRNLDLADSARVQVLVDLTGSRASEVTLDTITVGGAGTALGLVAQGEATPIDWDASVVREGDTLTNDEMHTGLLDVLDAAMSSDVPSDPGAARDGLIGIIMPYE